MKLFDNIKQKMTSFSGVFSMGDWTHQFDWNKTQALGLYEKSLYVNKAINKRAEKVGQIKFTLKKGDREIENEWTKLLHRPNGWQTGDQFWGIASKYLDIFGQVFIVKDAGLISKKVSSLKLLRPDKVTVQHTKDEIMRYDFIDEGKVTKYEPDEIIYINRPDPRNPMLGESLLASATRTIETEVQISQYHANVLKNGGKLESIFKVKGNTTQDQFESLQKQYKAKYAEAKNAGIPLFLAGDIELLTTGLKPSELSFLETKITTLDDISIATGVPKVILGVGSKETYANAEQEIRTFYSDTIKPICDLIVDVLNWRLIPDEFDLTHEDPTPENIEQKLRIIEVADKTNAVTINEKRIALAELGFDLAERPEKEADALYIPFNITEITTEKSIKKKDFNHPLRNYDYRRQYEKIQVKKISEWEAIVEKGFRKFFTEQKERVLQNIKTLDSELEIRLARTTILKYLKDIIEDGGQEAMTLVGATPNFVMGSSVNKFIRERAELFANEITSTTQEKLAKLIEENIAAGGSRIDLEKGITELYEGFTEKRASTIARTEVHNTYQKGHIEGYIQAGVEIKIWVTVGDDRVREEHAMNDGVEVPIHQRFPNGEMYPGESSINCRCSI
jgi:HK97 family phage portal protein